MKKYFLGIIAVILAFGFSAFTAVKESPDGKNLNTQFRYKGPSAPNEDYSNVNNWEISSTSCGLSGSTACLVTPNVSTIDTRQELVDEYNLHQFSNMAINSTKQ